MGVHRFPGGVGAERLPVVKWWRHEEVPGLAVAAGLAIVTNAGSDADSIGRAGKAQGRIAPRERSCGQARRRRRRGYAARSRITSWRHCEEHLRRSNPRFRCGCSMDCFAITGRASRDRLARNDGFGLRAQLFWCLAGIEPLRI